VPNSHTPNTPLFTNNHLQTAVCRSGGFNIFRGKLMLRHLALVFLSQALLSACGSHDNASLLLSDAQAASVQPPSSVTAQALSTSQIKLSWVDNQFNGQTDYIIQRSLDGFNFGVLTQVSASLRSYTDSGLSPSTKYYYRLQTAKNG